MSAKPRPGRAKFLYENELGEPENECTNAYRPAKLLYDTESQPWYTETARAVERIVAREKLNAFRFTCDELQNSQLAQSQAIIKRISRAKLKYVVKQQPPGNIL